MPRPDLDYGLWLIHMELLREEVDHEGTPLLNYNLPKFIHTPLGDSRRARPADHHAEDINSFRKSKFP